MPESEPLPPYSRGITTAALQRGYVKALQEEQLMGPILKAMDGTVIRPFSKWVFQSTSLRASIVARYHFAREKIEADRMKASAVANRRREARRRAAMVCDITSESCVARADKCECATCKEWLGNDETASGTT